MKPGLFLDWFRFAWLALGILAPEAFDAAGGIQQLLLAGEEGMAVRADFHVDVAAMGRAGRKAVAAGAHDSNFVVSRMNGRFHGGFQSGSEA